MWKTCLSVLALMSILCSPITLKAEEISNSLPASELAKYSDSFDTLREDLWERQQYTWNEAQRANFKLADITIQDGRLKVETQTGGFSKAALNGKFFFRGDFDIQIDVSFEFLKKEVKMDQRVHFLVLEKGKSAADGNFATIELLKKEGHGQGALMTLCYSWRKFSQPNERRVDAFHGTLRFVRKGKTVRSLCQDKGASEWKEIYSCSCTDKDVFVGIGLSNFFLDRSSIKADDPISATFDNFKINAAQGIVESEI